LDVTNIQTLEQRINDISQELLITAFDILARRRKQKPVSDAELIAQEESQKQLKFIMGIYANLKKVGIISSQASAEAFDRTFIQRVKSQTSSVGDIVRNTTT
jgi:hypothetical protein